MADTPGDGGLSICNVSPSDQAGQINNILDRLTNCEIAIAKLAGLDVTATNASDMVASLGTITNGTIIMPDNSVSGWTNSIPPGDFSGTIISNGIITTWNNGVVSYEVQPSGVTVGGGGSSSFARIRITGSTSISSISESVDADGLVSISSPDITIASSGVYLFGLLDSIDILTTANGDYSLLQVYDGSFNIYATSGLGVNANSFGQYVGTGSCYIRTIASDNFTLTAQIVGTGTWAHYADLSILKLA